MERSSIDEVGRKLRESRQSVETSKRQIKEQREIADKQKKAFQEQQVQLQKQRESVSAQRALRTSGLAGRMQRREKQKIIETGKEQTVKELENIGKFKQELTSKEKEIARLEPELKKAEKEYKAYKLAERVFKSSDSRAIFSLSPYFGGSKRAQEYYRMLKAGEVRRRPEIITIKDIPSETITMDRQVDYIKPTLLQSNINVLKDLKNKIGDITISKEMNVPTYDPIKTRGTIQVDTRTGKEITTRDIIVPEVKLRDATRSVIEAPSRITQTVARGVGASTGFVAGQIERAKFGKRDSITSTITLPDPIKTRGTIQVDTRTGKEITTRDITITETKEEAIKKAEKLGSIIGTGATYVGAYSVPFFGGALLASESERQLRPYNYNVIEYAKDKPIEAAINIGFVGALAGAKGYKAYKSPVIATEGEKTFLSTRGRNILDTKIQIPTKRGETFGIRKPKIDNYPVVIERVAITKRFESGMDVPSTVVSLGDETTIKAYQQYFTPIEKTSGVSRQLVSTGEKAVVIKKGNIIFEGLSPSSKLGKIQREITIKELGRFGLTEESAKSYLQLRRPKIVESQSKISGFYQEGTMGRRIQVRQEETLTPVRKQFRDDFGGTTLSIGGKERKVFRVAELKPVKTSAEEYWVGKGVEGKVKVSKKGTKAETETFEVLSKPRKVGEGEIRFMEREIEGVGKVSTPKEFQFFESGTITKGKDRLDISKGDIIKKKPEKRQLIDLDEAMGITDVKFIEKSGKRSSPEYLKELYQRQEQAQEIAIKSLPKTKIEEPKKVSPIVETKTQTKELPLMVGGAGLKQIPFEGTGIYERMQTSGSLSTGLISKQEDRLNIDVTPKVETKVSQVETTALKQGSRFKGLDITVPKIDIQVKQREEQKPIDISTTVQKLIQKTKTKQILDSSTDRPRQIDIIKQVKPKKPTIKKPSSLDIGKSKKESKKPSIFTIFARKEGKDIKVGTATTKIGAEKILSKSLSQTLKASGFVKEGGKKIKASELKLTGSEFRKSKVDPFRVVEKKEKRLKRGTKETKEIQLFKKIKSKSLLGGL